MKKTLFTLCILFATCTALANDRKAAQALLSRIAPEMSAHIEFEKADTDEKPDFFELFSRNHKTVIRGNSANSMAVGLNHYLKYYCNTTVSWYADDPVELPRALPEVSGKVRVESRTDKRFFLNYCTFGYTLPWWKWRDWERLIDWMALNGVNMPLAITGQESVWLRVWKDLGLEEKDIKAYFTGPAHLGWHRMANFDSFQGPLPDSYLKHQEQLQKKILQRERELNMRPVLPAFAGHVPHALARLHPEAKISRMSQWGGFRDDFRSYFLDPMDPLFKEIQQKFLKTQERMYGTDHIYGADPFNEMKAPSWDPNYLATVSRTIYETMSSADKEATWVQMGWLFFQSSKQWTAPRINAFLNAVPKGKLIMLDYYGDKKEIWKQTESFYGQPFIWCYLGNFGGNTMLAGNLAETGRRIENVFRNGGDNFAGIGSTLEGFDVNPFMYEYVFEKAWNHRQTDQVWMESLADRRFGKEHQAVRKAWQLLLEKVYLQPAVSCQSTITNSRPSFKGYGRWNIPHIGYRNSDLFYIWKLMLEGKDEYLRDTYVFDVVNLGRQVLGNYFNDVRNAFTAAYEARNREAARRKGMEMLEILSDLDRLLYGHSTFSLGRWIEAADAFGTSPEEKAYFRKNARTLLTTWGEPGQALTDYANRSWSGLTKSYYQARWEAFIHAACHALDREENFNEKDFRKQLVRIEKEWMENDFISSSQPRKNGVGTAYELMQKYETRISGN